MSYILYSFHKRECNILCGKCYRSAMLCTFTHINLIFLALLLSRYDDIDSKALTYFFLIGLAIFLLTEYVFNLHLVEIYINDDTSYCRTVRYSGYNLHYMITQVVNTFNGQIHLHCLLNHVKISTYNKDTVQYVLLSLVLFVVAQACKFRISNWPLYKILRDIFR